MFVFARRLNLAEHRLGRQAGADQETELGLFALAVAVQLGKVFAHTGAGFDLEYRFAVGVIVDQEIGNAVNPAIGTLFLVNPRLVFREGEYCPFFEFFARLVVLAVGQRNRTLDVFWHTVEQYVGFNLRPFILIRVLKPF